MKKSNKTGILVDGSLRSAGVTFYTQKTIVVENKDIGNYTVVPGVFFHRETLLQCQQLLSFKNIIIFADGHFPPRKVVVVR